MTQETGWMGPDAMDRERAPRQWAMAQSLRDGPVEPVGPAATGPLGTIVCELNILRKSLEELGDHLTPILTGPPSVREPGTEPQIGALWAIAEEVRSLTTMTRQMTAAVEL